MTPSAETPPPPPPKRARQIDDDDLCELVGDWGGAKEFHELLRELARSEKAREK